MALYENPLNYGEDDQDHDPLFPFGDPVQKAAEAQREKLKKEAAETAEKEAKEAKRKAEKEAKLARKMADKAAKDLEDKADKLTDQKEDVKEKIEEAKEAITESADQLVASAESMQTEGAEAPVAMRFDEGSEYISELKEGEEAIFELSHEVVEAEEAVDLADEVTARAEALAQARAALSEVASEDMGVENTNLQESNEVFGLSGPEQDVRERLRGAWEYREETPIDQMSDTNQLERIDGDDIELPAPVSSSSYDYTPSDSAYSYDARPAFMQEQPSPAQTAEARTKEPRESYVPIAAVGGFITGRLRGIKSELGKVTRSLRGETTSLVRSTELPYTPPVSRIESTPDMLQKSTPPAESLPPAPTGISSGIETLPKGGMYDVVPKWIRELDAELKKGKLPELKKWQLDILASQHPNILKTYQKLDQDLKVKVKTESIELSAGGQGSTVPFMASAVSNARSDVPIPASMPAYMQPSVTNTPTISPLATAYQSPAVSAPRTASVSVVGVPMSSAYITIVGIGGVLFGALLIGIFGF